MYLSTTRLVLPVCKLGSLPVCLSTTRLVLPVCLSTTRLTASVLTRLTDSVFIYNKCVNLYCQCVYLLQGLLPMCLSATRRLLPVCKLHCQCVYLQQGLYCQCVNKATASVFIYNKAFTANVLTTKALPVCLSTTMLVLPVC